MKTCAECVKESADDARYCSHCGASLSTPIGAGTSAVAEADSPDAATAPIASDEQAWRLFIGPKADHYLAKFRSFTSASGPKFALTWNWAAFIFEPFLWFLYRKMYLYALVYALGPVLAFFFTQDMSADIVWRIMAGVSANYLYYWHIREQLAEIRKQTGVDGGTRERLIRDAGGVQVYVVWVGIGLLVLKIGLVAMVLQRNASSDIEIPESKFKRIQSQLSTSPGLEYSPRA